MKTSIIVVADSSRARIFTADSARSPLNEIEVMVNPLARLHERDITSDLPGKNSGGDGSGTHAYSNKVEPKKYEQIEFARKVAGYLDDARKDNKLSNLLIVATPTFLGEIRTHLSSLTSDKIVFELNKNLTQLSIDDISEHLPKSYKH